MIYFQMSQQNVLSLNDSKCLLYITGFKTFCFAFVLSILDPPTKKSLNIFPNMTNYVHQKLYKLWCKGHSKIFKNYMHCHGHFPPTTSSTEDYDHVKLKSPYSWYVGTRYGEATGWETSTVPSPVEKPAGFRFQADRFSAKQPFLVDLVVVFLCFSGSYKVGPL